MWNTEIQNNLCSYDAYSYLGGMTMTKNIRQTVVGAVMEEEISYSQQAKGGHCKGYSM